MKVILNFRNFLFRVRLIKDVGEISPKNWRMPCVVCLSIVIFVFTFSFGLKLASHRPLWNDEIYTLIASVKNISYGDMFLGKISEGNVCPLFYVLQKLVCDLSGYQVPEAWLAGTAGWGVRDSRSEILLRINPVIFMSLAVTAIFYFFSRFYSAAAGLLSLFVSFSSYMVWAYWAEARPYALWFFLTTVQSLMFLYLTSSPKNRQAENVWSALTVVHLLMAFTTVFSAAQVAIVSALIWVFKERNWKKYVLLTVIPVMIAVFYYSQTPRYDFWFTLTPEQLIRKCFSRDRFYILYMFVFLGGLYFCQKRTGHPKLFSGDSLLRGVSYFFLTLLTLCAAFFVLFLFVLGDTHGQSGFPVSVRYFIFLTPVGIIATTLLSYEMIVSLQGKWWLQILLAGGIGYLLIHRMLKLIPAIKGLYPEYFA